MPRTLATCFDPRRNSLNALRLFLALLVIVSHAWPLGGFGEEPSIGSASLGAWAVQGFFVVSGYLITGSRLRSTFTPYLWRRFLRIFPGLWVCLLVTALVFAPIAATFEPGDDELDLHSLTALVAHNGVLERGHLQLGDTLSGVSFPYSWNGSLWTLFYEFTCYLLVGGLLLARWRSARRSLTVVAFAACTAFHVGVTEFGLHAPDNVVMLAQLGMYFFAGAVLYAYADRVPVRAYLAAGASPPSSWGPSLDAMCSSPHYRSRTWPSGAASRYPSRASVTETTSPMGSISTRSRSSSCSPSPSWLASASAPSSR